MNQYMNATICLNGHVISTREISSYNYCPDCGQKPISHCPSCDVPIEGELDWEYSYLNDGYEKPSYCHNCGKAFPWIETLLRNAVELISLDDELSSSDKELIKQAMPDLIVETPTSPVAAAKFKKVISKGTDLTKAGIKNLLFDAVSEGIKKVIF